MKRSSIALLGLVTLSALAAPLPVSAQGAETMLSLEPHCTQEDRSSCAAFGVVDASRVTTLTMNVGDILDIDVVLRTNQPAAVRDIRSWLKYDKAVLEARSIELGSVITSPIPGEQSIDSTQSIVKIGGGVQGLSQNVVTVARVTFRVIKAGTDTTVEFDQFLPSGAGHTAVNGEGVSQPGVDNYNGSLPAPPCIDVLIGCGTTARTPMLLARPASLVVELGDSVQSSSSSQATGTTSGGNGAGVLTTLTQSSSSSVSGQTGNAAGTTSTAGSTSSAAGSSTRFDVAPSGFTLLQVQGVQVTTRDASAYLGWQELKSTEVKGYNIYYGAVSGRYLQRRSIPPSYTSTIIRDLEPGQQYYFAVRAYNERNEETMFSREVSVIIGQPETASSPLLASGLNDNNVENVMYSKGGTTITGETGVGTSVMFLLIVSAVIGTIFAFRRQLTFPRSHVA